MKVLIMGGTGAMGTPLRKYLVERGDEVHVTSRAKHIDEDIIWHLGNAHDKDFLSEVLSQKFDAIVDFMSYQTNEFAQKIEYILNSTKQYFFISSCRVYAPSVMFITEESPLLLDVCDDYEYLKTDEYALSKARQEELLKSTGLENWTIVRPGLTYNAERLQYAIGEKEEWLYRYLCQKKIVFPKNMNDIMTTMGYGKDVARAISLLIGNERALTQTVHITGPRAITWEEVNKIYSEVLYEKYSRKPEFMLLDDWQQLGKDTGKTYQLKYARAISRQFDNSKLERLIGSLDFMDPKKGLSECLKEFLYGEMIFKENLKIWDSYYDSLCE